MDIPEFEHRLSVRNGIQVYDRTLFGGDDPVMSGPVAARRAQGLANEGFAADVGSPAYGADFCYALPKYVAAICVRRALRTLRKPFHLPADRVCGTAVQLFDGSGRRVVREVWTRCPDEESTDRHA
jgi:hypothetical protein